MRYLICLFTLLSGPFALAAENELSEAEQRARNNYAFAAYTGSGIYAATDASVFVVNVPYTYAWQKSPDTRTRLNVSGGAFDYDFEDIENLDLPTRLGTLTVIPGVERTFHISPRWEVIPHVDLGFARNFSADSDAIVYSTGIHSRFYLDGDPDHHLWINKVIVAGYRSTQDSYKDGYVRLITGFDYKTSLDFNIKSLNTVPTFYGLLAWERNGTTTLQTVKPDSLREVHVEVGVSLYTGEPLDLGFWKVKRIGLGVQQTEFGTVVRLFLGTPF